MDVELVILFVKLVLDLLQVNVQLVKIILSYQALNALVLQELIIIPAQFLASIVIPLVKNAQDLGITNVRAVKIIWFFQHQLINANALLVIILTLLQWLV